MSADPAPAALGQPSNQPACTRPHHTRHLATKKRAEPCHSHPVDPQVAALRKWLKGLPLSRRPLVKLSAQVAPEPAVKMLQARRLGEAPLCPACKLPACTQTGWESSLVVTMDQPEPDVRPSQTVGVPLTMHCCSALLFCPANALLFCPANALLFCPATCRRPCRRVPRSSRPLSWRMWQPRCCCHPRVRHGTRMAAGVVSSSTGCLLAAVSCLVWLLGPQPLTS